MICSQYQGRGGSGMEEHQPEGLWSRASIPVPLTAKVWRKQLAFPSPGQHSKCKFKGRQIWVHVCSQLHISMLPSLADSSAQLPFRSLPRQVTLLVRSERPAFPSVSQLLLSVLQILKEYLMCARHCPRSWDLSREQDRQRSYPLVPASGGSRW